MDYTADMTDELKSPQVERPYRLNVGDTLWETALQQYADPELQKRIRENGGFANIGESSRVDLAQDMSKRLDVVRENMTFFLIREAARYLYERGTGRISANDIATLLTTSKFSMNQATVVDKIHNKYPFLIDYYDLFVQTRESINKKYGDAIRELWEENKRKPTKSEIAKRLRIKYGNVHTKLEGANRHANPAWLIQLYDQGPKGPPGSDNSE